jgi:hypothetical protein
MQPPRLFTLLLMGLASTSPAEESGLESVQRAQWKYQDYTNATYGISVSVKARPEAARTGATWGGGHDKILVENGRKVSVFTHEDDRQTAEARVPLDATTIEYLLVTSTEPGFVRFIAASHITQSALPLQQQLDLLKKGIALREASLRYYIWHDIRQFQPREKVAALLHLALRDPCLEIAYDSLPAIIKEYHLTASDGSPLTVTGAWRGMAFHVYIGMHREILAAAQSLRRTRPDLMPEEELQKITSRATPSDAWFEKLGPDKAPRAKALFRGYLAQSQAEQESNPPPPSPADKESTPGTSDGKGPGR